MSSFSCIKNSLVVIKMKSLCIVIKDELFKFEAHIYEIILFIYLYLQGYNLTWYSSSSIILHSPIKGIHKYFFVLAILKILIIPVNENRFAFVKQAIYCFLCHENMKLLRYGLSAISSCYKIYWH